MLELSFRIRNYECNLQSFYQYYCLVLSTQLKLQLLVLYKIYDRNTVYNSSMLSHHSDDITSLSIYTVEIEDDTQTVSWYSQASLHCISVSSYACVCVCACLYVLILLSWIVLIVSSSFQSCSTYLEHKRSCLFAVWLSVYGEKTGTTRGMISILSYINNLICIIIYYIPETIYCNYLKY